MPSSSSSQSGARAHTESSAESPTIASTEPATETTSAVAEFASIEEPTITATEEDTPAEEDMAKGLAQSAERAESVARSEGAVSSTRSSVELSEDSQEDASDAPPLPNEPAPDKDDDGWDFQWDATHQAYFFYNRLTGQSQWNNPRVPPTTDQTDASGSAVGTPAEGVRNSSSDQPPLSGGYNPAIHGDYDPNAWYAKKDDNDNDAQEDAPDSSALYSSTASFNRFTGQFQTTEMGPDRHNDESKSKRQMNAFFDVDAAANAHDGRSLKAERSGKKPSKSELKQFKEKRRARKEEKRRAWLRD
jgi:hypothetical protein